MKKIVSLTVLILFFVACNSPEAKFVPVTPEAVKEVDAAIKPSFNRGSIIYNKYCLSCHMADGSGVQNMNPPLNSSYVNGGKDSLIQILLNGLNKDIVVNGNTYSNPMPSHKQLTDEQIADVLTFARNSFGNLSPAVMTADVKKLRSHK